MNNSRLRNYISRIKSVSALGATSYESLKIFLAFLYFTAHDKLGVRNIRPRRFVFKIYGRAFDLFLANAHEMEMAREIFINEEYKSDLLAPTYIFDLGSNIGLSALYFRAKYPRARIYSFEPSPVMFERLKQNIGTHEGLYAYRYAVAGIDGAASLFFNPYQSLSSSLYERAGNKPSVEVEARSLESIMNQLNVHEIDILKFDIEGAEYDVFKNFGHLHKIKHIIGEVHLDIMRRDKQEFLSLFTGRPILMRELKKDSRYILESTVQ